MKTTVKLDDDLAQQVSAAAHAAAVNMDQLVNDLVREGLRGKASSVMPERERFVQRTHDFGPPILPNLDKVAHLADDLQDAHVISKIRT